MESGSLRKTFIKSKTCLFGRKNWIKTVGKSALNYVVCIQKLFFSWVKSHFVTITFITFNLKHIVKLLVCFLSLIYIFQLCYISNIFFFQLFTHFSIVVPIRIFILTVAFVVCCLYIATFYCKFFFIYKTFSCLLFLFTIATYYVYVEFVGVYQVSSVNW